MKTGDVWGPYRILHYLGSGAMGEYLARNEREGRDVAVKHVRRGPGVDGEEKIAAERLGAELEKQLSVVDRRVTKVFWYGEIENDLAIEMEYVDGADLSTQSVAPGRAAVIALELCEMLENLRAFETQIDGRHLSGVIHGDLKPKNVRIDSRGQIRVMDFGVAKALSRTRDYTASLFGSIAYCSPERLDSGSMDSNSDLWSVGVMLYQMVAGRLPFEGDTPERLERRIRSRQPPDPLSPVCPVPLANIIFKMLSRDLEQRYPSAMAVHADLERFVKGDPVEAPAPPAFDATVRTVHSDDETRRTTRPPEPKRSPVAAALWKLAAAGLAALFAICVLLWLLIQPQYRAWADTQQLKHDIETEHVDANAAWDRYESIVKRKHLSMVTWGIGSPLKSKLMASGEAPIADFRENDFPTAREGQWRRSIMYFSRAMELDPGDKTVKGKLRLCEGHLERITAAGASRQQMLNDSAEKFREAAELLKKSPDPYIGLARLYSYNLGDCDRAQEALKKAVQYGHTETRREIATLADSYMRRAAQSVRDSQKFRSLPDNEREYLKRARADFEHAQDLYSRLGSFANAPLSLIGSVRGINQVNNRLEEMDMVSR